MSKEEQKTKAESQRSSSTPDSSIPHRDTQTSKSDNLIFKAGLREDGTFDLNFELRKEFDISEKIGRIGWYILILGVLLTIAIPILYFNSIITSISLAIAAMSTPFAIGSGLITAANNFEYFPFVK